MRAPLAWDKEETIMELIKTPRTIPSHATNISPECEDSTLWHLEKHRYAFTIPQKKNPVLAFESEMFTELLLSLGTPIAYINVFQIVYLLCHQKSSRLEVHLELEDGSCFQMEDNGTIKYNNGFDPKIRGYGVFPVGYNL